VFRPLVRAQRAQHGAVLRRGRVDVMGLRVRGTGRLTQLGAGAHGDGLARDFPSCVRRPVPRTRKPIISTRPRPNTAPCCARCARTNGRKTR
ncbi:MAG: hypothetical protein AAFN04_17015, partial [Pseudomonadota bacterium]